MLQYTNSLLCYNQPLSSLCQLTNCPEFTTTWFLWQQWARSGIKLASWFRRPRKEHSCILFAGKCDEVSYLVFELGREIYVLASGENQVEAFVQTGVVWGMDQDVVHDFLGPWEVLYDGVWYFAPVVWQWWHAHWWTSFGSDLRVEWKWLGNRIPCWAVLGSICWWRWGWRSFLPRRIWTVGCPLCLGRGVRASQCICCLLVCHESYFSIWLGDEKCVAAPWCGFWGFGDDSLVFDLFAWTWYHRGVALLWMLCMVLFLCPVVLSLWALLGFCCMRCNHGWSLTGLLVSFWLFMLRYGFCLPVL